MSRFSIGGSHLSDPNGHGGVINENVEILCPQQFATPGAALAYLNANPPALGPNGAITILLDPSQLVYDDTAISVQTTFVGADQVTVYASSIQIAAGSGVGVQDISPVADEDWGWSVTIGYDPSVWTEFGTQPAVGMYGEAYGAYNNPWANFVFQITAVDTVSNNMTLTFRSGNDLTGLTVNTSDPDTIYFTFYQSSWNVGYVVHFSQGMNISAPMTALGDFAGNSSINIGGSVILDQYVSISNPKSKLMSPLIGFNGVILYSGDIMFTCSVSGFSGFSVLSLFSQDSYAYLSSNSINSQMGYIAYVSGSMDVGGILNADVPWGGFIAYAAGSIDVGNSLVTEQVPGRMSPMLTAEGVARINNLGNSYSTSPAPNTLGNGAALIAQ